MTEQTLYVIIAIKVKSNMSLENTIDEFGGECNYNFPSTENVEVVNTEWIDTTTSQP